MSRKGTRLDVLLVERGWFDSRSRARAAILAGRVRVDGRVVDKAGATVDPGAQIEVAGDPIPYVSRGGLKLEHALRTFNLTGAVQGAVCADIGASTGGFTDCLLQHGARKVYAIDVGYGQLAWRLRQDPRVVVMERVNARYLAPSDLAEPVHLVTVDVSFISLRLILPAALGVLAPGGGVVALVKPQFEAGPADVGKGGVVRDPAVHRRVLEDVTAAADQLGLTLLGLTASPIRGADGNREFLALWRAPGRAGPGGGGDGQREGEGAAGGRGEGGQPLVAALQDRPALDGDARRRCIGALVR
ncbi:hemolysin A [Thermaerobacter marianensis DSM 12885]|uniref:Hemolysin A n=1 Tax=Thermaerobacter marianensis (strain ATCC 700841 / DSM 12885 / JCM 10246 / 7p75a) TaxID=644966 RepID=E6SKS1_THEM7|nr:TlyA family RNA methyltransferase [Thermaerobacter marianensis]ADU51279.1 hemolysin A [Thermaerobacter marianensis DSM 12885]